MDPIEDDFVNDEPLASGHASRSGRRRPRRSASIMEPTSSRWAQARDRAGQARQRTELFLRENPVPMILGALAAGLALGLAIRFASSSEEKEEAKTPLGRVNWGALTLPFLWPFFHSLKEKYEDSAEAVKAGVRNIDVERYTKPIRKRWKSWMD